MQRLPELILSEKGKPRTEGTSELTIAPGMRGTTGVTWRFRGESGHLLLSRSQSLPARIVFPSSG